MLISEIIEDECGGGGVDKYSQIFIRYGQPAGGERAGPVNDPPD